MTETADGSRCFLQTRSLAHTSCLLPPQGPLMSQRSGFSCQSAGPDMAQYHKISVGGGGFGGGGGGGDGGGGFYRESMRMGHYQSSLRHQSQMDHEPVPMPAVGQLNPWIVDGSDAASMVSDRDAVFSRQYSQSIVNGYGGSMRQGGGTSSFSMRRSLSGTLSRATAMGGGEVEIAHQPSFKGPAHRTISRIANRNRMSMGSMSGTIQRQVSSWSAFNPGGDSVDGFIAPGLPAGSQGNLTMQRQGAMSRAMSVKSMQSVGRGKDSYAQMEMGASMGNLNG